MAAEINDPSTIQELQATIAQQAEQIAELQAKLDLFQTFIDAFPNPMSMLEVLPNGRYSLAIANKAYLSGFESPDIIGKDLKELAHEEELASVQRMYEDCLQHKTIQVYEMTYPNPEGGLYWLLNTCMPVVDPEDQKISHIVCSIQDVTERKYRELQEKEAINEQQSLIEQQAEVLAEISTPLLSISDSTMVMPLIGVIDTHRINNLVTTLLNGVSENRARTVILDITGVPFVDTQVANAIIRSAQAVKLLGATIILSGIRPEVAQVLVGLGIDFSHMVTCSTLQAAIALALRQEKGFKAPA